MMMIDSSSNNAIITSAKIHRIWIFFLSLNFFFTVSIKQQYLIDSIITIVLLLLQRRVTNSNYVII